MADIFDTNVNNYSISELMEIAGVDDLDVDTIQQNIQAMMKKAGPQMSAFLLDVQSTLLKYADQNNAGEPITDKITSDWIENEHLEQNDTNQSNKVTNRQNKTQLYNNDHVPMKQEQLGVSNTYNVPVAQDSLNPNLKNSFQRFVNLDSQFRQSGNGVDTSSTDFTLDLSDPLIKALSICLYSYQIPYTWYVIDETNGNSFFWITQTNLQLNIPVIMPDGNYTASAFVSELIVALGTAGFTFPSTPVQYNTYTGKLTLNLFGGVYLSSNGATTFTISESTILTFFDYTSQMRNDLLQTTTCNTSNYINQTLGWIMGYRTPYVEVAVNGNPAPAVLDLNGTKYLILVIDDYNQNHVNNGLVSITEFSNNLKLPSYYTPDLTHICIEADGISDNISSLQGTNGLNFANKLNVDYVPRQVIVPSAPRTLTQSQIYTINEIIKNRSNNTNFRAKAPTNPDILAILPIKSGNLSTGSMIIDASGSLQDNSRAYFGPVNIERMKIKLLDDKGNILNLNGADWCFTLICECLYQY